MEKEILIKNLEKLTNEQLISQFYSAVYIRGDVEIILAMQEFIVNKLNNLSKKK